MQHARRVPGGRTADAARPRTSKSLAAGAGAPLAAVERSYFEPRFGHDFSRVRVHADARAAAAARDLSAAAFTLGQDIYFAADRFRPDSAPGRALLAHELAHVVQGIPNTIQRQPAVPQEEPALRAARLRAIAQIRAQIPILMQALDQGFLFGQMHGPVEELIQGGVRTNYGISSLDPAQRLGPIEETFAQRAARMRLLMSDLARLSAILEAGPMPTDWFSGPPTSEPCTPYDLVNLRNNAATAWRNGDANILYGCYSVRIGRSYVEQVFNTIFVLDQPIRTRQAPRRPVERASETGIYLHVPDPANAPMQYRRITGKEGWQGRGVIVTVWRDAAGHFYYRGDERMYLPERP